MTVPLSIMEKSYSYWCFHNLLKSLLCRNSMYFGIKQWWKLWPVEIQRLPLRTWESQWISLPELGHLLNKLDMNKNSRYLILPISSLPRDDVKYLFCIISVFNLSVTARHQERNQWQHLSHQIFKRTGFLTLYLVSIALPSNWFPQTLILR